MISTLRKRLNILDVSTTNTPDLENLNKDNDCASRLGLPTSTPQPGFGRRSFGARFYVNLGLEDGDMDWFSLPGVLHAYAEDS